MPILKVSHTHPLAEDYSEAQQLELEKKTKDIQRKFLDCIRETAHCLRNVEISEVEDFLRPALALKEEKLQKFDSPNKLLSFLVQERWLSWFNYELLEDLINKFLQGVFSLDSYKKALKEYASGRVEEYEGVQFGLPAKPGQHKVFLLKIDPQYKNIKALNDIKLLQSSICEILGQYTLLYLVTFHCSIITLEILLPLHLCADFFVILQEQRAELAQVGVETGVFETKQQGVHKVCNPHVCGYNSKALSL